MKHDRNEYRLHPSTSARLMVSSINMTNATIRRDPLLKRERPAFSFWVYFGIVFVCSFVVVYATR